MKNVPMPLAIAFVVVAVLVLFVVIRKAMTPATPVYNGPPRSYMDQYRSQGEPGPGR
jgi:hypothetical protein